MRRYLILFLCLCLFLCGCAPQAKEVVQSVDSNATDPTITETVPTIAIESEETASSDKISIGELIFPLGNIQKHDIVERNIHIILLTENTTYLSILCTDMKVSGNMEPEKFASILHNNWLTESANDTGTDFFHHAILNNDIYFEHQITESNDSSQLYWLVGTFYTDSYFYTIAYTSKTNEESEIKKFSDYLDQISCDAPTFPNLISVKHPILKTEETEPTETKQQNIGSTYVLNTNTKKFHRPTCSSAKKMKDSNKSTFTGTRDDVIAKGYKPCNNCNP